MQGAEIERACTALSIAYARRIDFDGPAAVGHYADRFRLTPGGWRFAERKLHFAFRNPAFFP